MVEEYVNLFHGTEYDCLEAIEEDGVRSQASRGMVSESQRGRVRHETVYLYDPEELSDFILEDFEEVFVECKVPRENLYVTKYGSGAIQNMTVDELEENAYTFEDYENDDLPYLDSTSLMFFSTEDIPPENILALKWSL